MIAGTQCWGGGDEIAKTQFRKDETTCRPLFGVQGETFVCKINAGMRARRPLEVGSVRE